MMLKLVAAVGMLALTAPAMAQTMLDDSLPAGIDFAKLHGAVTAEFLDPRSAQYKHILTYKRNGATVVCGLVNAKNSIGGYTPFVPFFYNPDKNVAVVAETTGDPLIKKMSLKIVNLPGCLDALGIEEPSLD
jgi:hypothetical protein